MMNTALLSKWRWRYGLPQNVWKSIVQAKYGYDSRSLTLSYDSRRDMSQVWKKILNPFGSDADWQCVLKDGLNIKVGDGRSTKFWHDPWISGSTLKVTFPRIYALSTNKDGFIAEFGR